MIFLTVGTQLPFDRLVKIMDEWSSDAEEEVVAQIGRGEYKPAYMRTRETLSPCEYNEYVEAADLVVAHAGIGTIISAVSKGKPLIIMPRCVVRGEHRNDHQKSTVEYFASYHNVYVAMNKEEMLVRLRNRSKLIGASMPNCQSDVECRLVEEVKSIIDRDSGDRLFKHRSIGAVEWKGHRDV